MLSKFCFTWKCSLISMIFVVMTEVLTHFDSKEFKARLQFSLISGSTGNLLIIRKNSVCFSLIGHSFLLTQIQNLHQGKTDFWCVLPDKSFRKIPIYLYTFKTQLIAKTSEGSHYTFFSIAKVTCPQ